MPTWKEEMERQARYVREVRPDAFTMPLPEDKKQPKKKPTKKAKAKK